MTDTLFVVGGKGHIWHRSSAGVWSNHNIGAMGANDDLYGIHGLSYNEVYAVGYRRGSLDYTWWYKWDGNSWNVWTDAPTLTLYDVPTCIHCVASDDIYVGVYRKSTVYGYLIHWNGSTWTIIINGIPYPWFVPYSIWSRSSTEVYIAGSTSFSSPCLKLWNGSSASTSTTITSGLVLGHLYGLDDGTIFTCGTNTSSYGIYRGIWDSFNLDSISGIKCGDPFSQYSQNAYAYNGKAWFFGVSPTDNQISRVAIYDGASWSVTTLKSSTQYFNIGVAGTGNNIIAVYQGYVSNDAVAFIWDGSSWLEETFGDGGSFLPYDAWQVPDDDPPELVDQNPAPNSRISVSDSLIAFSIVDASDIETSTIDAYVNDTVAFTSETFLSPFDGPSASFNTTTFGELDGYRVILDYTGGDWDSYQLITVRVVAKDSFSNLMDTTYSFRTYDTESVEFTNIIPTPCSTRVDKDTIIQVDIFDRGSGVDSTSIDAYVEGIHAYIGNTGSFVYPYNGSLSALTPVVVTIDGYSFDGYRITIDKQGLFQSGSQINVIIDGLDKEGN